MTIKSNDIIYELIDNGSSKKAKLIRCLSNKSTIQIPEHVNAPGSNDDFTVYHISKSSFKNCENLTKIEFISPNNITYIGASAFEGCISLKNFEFPQNVNKISPNCFLNCINLKSVNAIRITSISESAFEGCRRLETISNNITDNLISIGKCAFKNCYNLSFEKDLNSLKYIEYNAFENCKKTIITGNSLSLKNGLKYDQINSLSHCHWKLPKKSLYSFLLLGIPASIGCCLSFFEFFDSWKYSIHISFASLFLLSLSLIPIFISYRKHNKSIFYSTLTSFFISLSILLLLLGINLFFRSNNAAIFKSLSIDKTSNNHYSLSSEPYGKELSATIDDIITESTSHNISSKDITEQNSTQILQIKDEQNVLMRITNFQHNTTITNVTINFDDQNQFITVKSTNKNIPVLIKSDDQTIELKNDVRIDISEFSSFSIEEIINPDTEETITVLYFQLNQVWNTTSNNILNIINFILMIITIVSFLLTLGFFIFNIHELQSVFMDNKPLIVMILLVITTIVSIIYKESPSDLISNIFSSLAGM